MKKIVFFCPIKEKETVKSAMFEAGAGKIGNYDSCSFETEGIGQFRPLAGSNAFIGDIGKLELVKEFKIEMVCSDEVVSNVILAMKNTHPYEEVAYEVYSLENF
jgi:hypothetical protein